MFALEQQAAAYRSEDRRFETALRLFMVMIEANIERDRIDSEATKAMASAAVDSADVLLEALRKEKP